MGKRCKNLRIQLYFIWSVTQHCICSNLNSKFSSNKRVQRLTAQSRNSTCILKACFKNCFLIISSKWSANCTRPHSRSCARNRNFAEKVLVPYHATKEFKKDEQKWKLEREVSVTVTVCGVAYGNGVASSMIFSIRFDSIIRTCIRIGTNLARFIVLSNKSH